MVFIKKVINSDPGTADIVGGNDWDKLDDYFDDVNITGPAKINTPTQFRSGTFKLRDSDNTHNYIFNTSNLSADSTVTYPALSTADEPLFKTFAATITGKTIDTALNPIKLRVDFKYTIFIDENDSNKYKCRDNDTGLIVSTDSSNASVPIQFAIDGANGKAILIRQGTYLCGTRINATNTYGAVYGEGNRDEQQEGIGSTILKKNYSDTSTDIFFDCFGDDFWYFELHDIVLKGNDEGIGLGFDHNIRQMTNVGIFNFRTGLKISHCVYTFIWNMIIEDCVGDGCFLDDPNTISFYGGRIKGNNVNLRIEDGGTVWFFGTNMEHGQTYGVYLDSVDSSIEPNHVHFIGCAFESFSATTELIHNEGCSVTFDKCNFQSSQTDFIALRLTSTAQDTEVKSCYFKANTSSTTFRITIDSGAKRTKFLHNKIHRGGQISSFVFTDNGTDTYCFGNAPLTSGTVAIPDKVILNEGGNIVLGTTTGTKIGTATTQKLGFFNKTPIAQKAANADTSGATLGQLETEVNELKQLLRDYGLLA